MRGFEFSSRACRLRPRALAVAAPGLATLSLLAPCVAAAAVLPGQVVLQSGDTPAAGAAVVDVGPAFVNAGGEVGFVGNLDDGDHYVFIGAGAAWLGSNDAAQVLSAVELTMDSNGLGNFVYAPDVDGIDGLYTDAGVLALVGQPAVGFPMGAVYSFHGGASMTADGAIYWVAGIDLNGDGFSDNRGFYRTPDGTAASIELLLAGGDAVDAFTLDNDASGIDFSYQVSEDGVHRIHVLNMEGPTGTDGFVWVDDVLVAREGDPTGSGDAWQAFDLVATNASGNYLFTGNTNGPFAGDEFVAYNGGIVVREGEAVAGVTLSGPAALRFVALSDYDQAVHAWGYTSPAGFRESVFFACDAADIAGTSQVVLTTIDDELDVDGDGAGDYTITDLTPTGPTVGRGMGETPFVYAQVALDDGMGVVTNAMIELPVSCCGNGAVNPFEECDDANADDTDDCLSTCLTATCGDGFIHTGVEECDDGNVDDTDECPTSCVPATCGDGFVHAGVEECDDGNAEDTDECLGTCVAATCGDGIVQDGVEECDDGLPDDDTECLADCTLPLPPGSTGGESTGGTGAGTGLDDTAGEGSGGASESGGPGPGSLSAGSGSSGGESETDTDTAGAAGDDGGCSCRTDAPRSAGLVWMGLGLLGLGLARRRRR